MNEHPQFAEALALYAMGALDDAQELAALQAHLGTCGDCRRELEALRADTALLALSANGPQPPARARQRLLTAVAAEPRMPKPAAPPQRYAVGRMRPRWMSFAPIAAMVLLAVFSLLLWLDSQSKSTQLKQAQAQIAQLQSDMQEKDKELAESKEVRDLLHAPDAWPVTLVQLKTPAQPQMKVVYSREKGSLLLMASNAPALPEDKIYELWLLPADGSAPMAAGWFKPDSMGSGMVFKMMASTGINAKGFAVTIEDAGGSQTPKGPIMFLPAG